MENVEAKISKLSDSICYSICELMEIMKNDRHAVKDAAMTFYDNNVILMKEKEDALSKEQFRKFMNIVATLGLIDKFSAQASKMVAYVGNDRTNLAELMKEIVSA